MPETVYLACKKLNGENACFTEVGDHVVSLYADVPTGLNKYKRKRFVISNVGETDEFLNAEFYARKFLEYCYCGYVYNICAESVENKTYYNSVLLLLQMQKNLKH